jgi:putative nucleotidyltransferase with HDIG domain
VRDLLLLGTSLPAASTPDLDPFHSDTKVDSDSGTAFDEVGVHDIDLCVARGGLQIAKQLADDLGGAYYPLDADRGVGRVILTNPQNAERFVLDVASFQGETLEADLAGRDFTINAMAINLVAPVPDLIDPHHGFEDLQHRCLRAVSPCSIENDPIRALRAIRLEAQLGFVIDQDTWLLVQQAAAITDRISVERLRDELVKLLSLAQFMDSMKRLDSAGWVKAILPELYQLKKVKQSAPHRWDVFGHTLRTLEALEKILPLDNGPPAIELPFREKVQEHLSVVLPGVCSRRQLLTLSALFHDLGKAHTGATQNDGCITFRGHETAGAQMAFELMQRLRFSNQACQQVKTTVQNHMRPLQLAQIVPTSRRAVHRFYRDTQAAGVSVAVLGLADHLATGGPHEDRRGWESLQRTVADLLASYFERHDTIVAPVPLLTGKYLTQALNLAPGPQVGRLLAELLEAQAAGLVTDEEQAKRWMKKQIQKNT